MESRCPQKVVVIGGGIAGLAAAHYLRKFGVEVELFEREAIIGGAVRSVLREEKYLLEQGPNAFLASADPLLRLARELSIDPQIVGSDEASCNRYIYRRGRMHRLPMGPMAFLKSGLLSFSGKARLLMEPWIRGRSAEGETLQAFALRRGGREVLEALVDPFVSGVWAGDPAELEVASVFPKLVEVERECGSILKGMKRLTDGTQRRGLSSFRWGMGTIAARLEEELKSRIRPGVAASGLEGHPAGGWRVHFSGWHAPVEADAVVVATPAHAAAKLLLPLDAKIFLPLSAIPYASLAVVHTAFREKELPWKPDGFGVLIPRGEQIRMLGSIWSSSIFPGRCPRGEVLLTNFIGGATDAALVDCSDEEIIAEVMKGLGTTMGITARPAFVSLKRWGQAIAQYTVGHRSRILEIRSCLENLPGLFLVGSYLDGISVSDTIAQARAEVDRVTRFLKARQK